MSRIRKSYPAKFKSQVALAAIREDAPVSELSSKYGVHGAVIQRWTKEALATLEGKFSGELESQEKENSTIIKELHVKIGQLTVERDFLVEASSRLGLKGAVK